MKKLILSVVLCGLFSQEMQACAWYDADTSYFNLFAQNMLKDKSYTPFLLTLNDWFYDDGTVLPDDNITDWQRYFDHKLSYQDTYSLVYKVPLKDLQNFANGQPAVPFLDKLGKGFYKKFHEGINYLIEAKKLEPFMRVKFVENPNSFYFDDDTNAKNATDLNFTKTVSDLEKLYHNARNKDIKLRYAYQLIRFNHYNLDFNSAVAVFDQFVAPLKQKTPVYYMALSQMAGAQRGMGEKDEANWNFFQVFLHSNRERQSSYMSMVLTDSLSFKHILNRASTKHEKNMAYFLLGYQDFNNPLSMMQKMVAIDPDSEPLRVLAARAINEIERSFLPVTYDSSLLPAKSASDVAILKNVTAEHLSFWERVKNFFTGIFAEKRNIRTYTKEDLKDIENPYRLPVQDTLSQEMADMPKQFLEQMEQFTNTMSQKTHDPYWQMGNAYLKFLEKNYNGSTLVLSNIKTKNPEYIAQIKKMEMLNDIVGQPVITDGFEQHLYDKYKDQFIFKAKNDSLAMTDRFNDGDTTIAFLSDILANRYFLQGEKAKSFLMNNNISALRNDPSLPMTAALQKFWLKPGKNDFEKYVISEGFNGLKNPMNLFNLSYGDHAMMQGDFEKARQYYSHIKDFAAFPMDSNRYDYATDQDVKLDLSKAYNGFDHVSALIFGHNTMVFYGGDEDKVMAAEPFINRFPFIKPEMNKAELAEAANRLAEIGNGVGQQASDANQLLGNLLYNTSILGYFRQTFVMDTDNSFGPKYLWDNPAQPYLFYYKDYGAGFLFPNIYGISTSFYQKALSQTSDREQQARILFQLASAEQGQFYYYRNSHPFNINYDDPDWSKKQDAYNDQMTVVLQNQFQTYFTKLRQYSDTKTSKELQGSCSYYANFLSD